MRGFANPQMKISYLKKKLWLGISFNEDIHNM
jgi:hypothetical protein